MGMETDEWSLPPFIAYVAKSQIHSWGLLRVSLRIECWVVHCNVPWEPFLVVFLFLFCCKLHARLCLRLCFWETQASIAGTGIVECDSSPDRDNKDPLIGGRWSGDTWPAASRWLRLLAVVDWDGGLAEGRVSGVWWLWSVSPMGIMVVVRIELAGGFILPWKLWNKKMRKMIGSSLSIINQHKESRESQQCLCDSVLGDSSVYWAEILIPKVTLQASNLDQPGCWPRVGGIHMGDGGRSTATIFCRDYGWLTAWRGLW